MLDNNKVVNNLNHLLGTLKDGENGYREAADELESGQFKTLFNRYAQQRAELSAELETEIRRLGGEPDATGSAAGALHRVWMNIREVISSRDDYAIISEAERGEDVAVDNYQKVMQEELPSNIQDFLATQFQRVKLAHDEVRDLKHSMKS